MINWYKIALEDQKNFDFYENLKTPKPESLNSEYQEWLSKSSPKDVRSIEPLIEQASNYAELVGILKSIGVDWNKINFVKETVITIRLGNELYVIDDFEYPNLKEATDWLNRIYDTEVFNYISVDDDNVDFNKTFWENPITLYHATQDENARLIEKNGLSPRNESRGINNRHTPSAVFTSDNPDDISNYGNSIFEINTKQMKLDGYTPNVSMESPIEDALLKKMIADRIGLEEYYPEEEYHSEGLYTTTVIIYGEIPPKYLKLI